MGPPAALPAHPRSAHSPCPPSPPLLHPYPPAQAGHRELDFELGVWGDVADADAGQFVVQPWTAPANLQRWALPAALAHAAPGGSPRGAPGAPPADCADSSPAQAPATVDLTFTLRWSPGRAAFELRDGLGAGAVAAPIAQWAVEDARVPTAGEGQGAFGPRCVACPAGPRAFFFGLALPAPLARLPHSTAAPLAPRHTRLPPPPPPPRPPLFKACTSTCGSMTPAARPCTHAPCTRSFTDLPLPPWQQRGRLRWRGRRGRWQRQRRSRWRRPCAAPCATPPCFPWQRQWELLVQLRQSLLQWQRQWQ